MIETKQSAAEEDTTLGGALGEQDRCANPPGPHASPGASGRWFRVQVTDLRSGRRKVNVNIPLGLVDFGLKMGAKFAPADFEGLDVDQIIAAIKAGGIGKIVDVEDEEDGKHVEVFVE